MKLITVTWLGWRGQVRLLVFLTSRQHSSNLIMARPLKNSAQVGRSSILAEAGN